MTPFSTEKKPSKYRNNHKTIYQGIPFDSQKEKNRYQELQLLERAGLIRRIELQPHYDLIVNGHKLGFLSRGLSLRRGSNRLKGSGRREESGNTDSSVSTEEKVGESLVWSGDC